MKIGLDIMGGDYAPKATVLGAIAAAKELSDDHTIVLIGNKDEALPIIASSGLDPASFELIHTTEAIGMSEHATKAISQKPNSSISIGFNLLKEGKIDSFASAGNTGAMLVGAVLSVKTISGVMRPAIGTNVPRLGSGFSIMLDVGANADCKPELLHQFGLLGSLFSQHVYGLKNPAVALLNIGEEEEKGNVLTQAAHGLMKDSSLYNFIGNIEGRDLFDDRVDVIVCDGFTGNVVLKLAESFYGLTVKKGFKDDFFSRFNYEQYGGSPILGVNAPVIIGHGISNPEAIKNMIHLSANMIRSNITKKIKAAFN
ncbi:phosphate:acyl-[acyl carrier protein] acyltransferase [bacterium A37T11]|nr:phosphate:acyl-[acyl carrier protein] acyltransferase [bacterium A37T11]